MEVSNVWVHNGPPVNEDFFPDGPTVDLRDVGRVFGGFTSTGDLTQVFVGKVDDPEQALVVTFLSTDSDDPELLQQALEAAYWTFVHKIQWSQPNGTQTI